MGSSTLQSLLPDGTSLHNRLLARFRLLTSHLFRSIFVCTLA